MEETAFSRTDPLNEVQLMLDECFGLFPPSELSLRWRLVNTSLFIRNHNYALNKQSSGSFLTALLDLTSKDRAKFRVAFQKES
jgi:hypothetical protein